MSITISLLCKILLMSSRDHTQLSAPVSEFAPEFLVFHFLHEAAVLNEQLLHGHALPDDTSP
jgi:hypothetical protein